MLIVCKDLVRPKAGLETALRAQHLIHECLQVRRQEEWDVTEPALGCEGGPQKVDEGVDLVLAHAHGA